MRRREFIAAIGGAAAWPLAARAQQPARVRRIGLLSAGSLLLDMRPVFSAALQELGWIEGKNIIFELRHVADQPDRLPALVAELLRLDVDVIVAGGTLAPLAAKRATATIPIVMSSAGDPLGSGLVASLAHPGGNVTGLSMMVTDLAGKWLEIVKELLPGVSRVAVLWNAADPYPALVFKQTQDAGRKLGIEVQSLEVRGPDDFDRVFEAAIQRRADALIAINDPLTNDYRMQIVGFAAGHQLLAMYGYREFVEAGGLISYGASIADLYRRTAGYVDKIFKGARPADLPVQQPTKFELVINLKTAKALGLTIPETLLATADEVIQ
jgi:putative tryptophan/tyrosine transport system substrate-binding protein